jgi:hypothetical protein
MFHPILLNRMNSKHMLQLHFSELNPILDANPPIGLIIIKDLKGTPHT